MEQKERDYTWTIIAGIIYVSLLVYFGWQTWQFVDWLFPAQQLGMKCLSLLSFDIMAFIWACIDTFDTMSRGMRLMVRWAWGIAFAFSLLASVLYLVIANMFRFNVLISQTTVDVGEAVSILALVVNVIFLTFFLLYKMSRKQRKPTRTAQPVTLAQTGIYPVYPAQKVVAASDPRLDQILQLLVNNQQQLPAPAREPKPFLASPARTRVRVRGQHPKKKLPPMHRYGEWIVNPFRKTGGKPGGQVASTEIP